MERAELKRERPAYLFVRVPLAVALLEQDLERGRPASGVVPEPHDAEVVGVASSGDTPAQYV
eukprot:CAMPEP_0185389068 /NCGR_PEP_ID=MMETSP1364-20130426/69491_1 /TAXON_ID=38817 /ORGANISM="Gephyrocapsa oceanica, Strain RCC1303" /LENGTH=61 /DNA_ID=CAMNT_0027991007 /DNA_START=9 /DNA_END=191 /DNA_ORIENTATION=-